MKKTLFFLEDPNLVGKVLKDSKTAEVCVYIALSPSASYAFERFDIPYRTLNDFGGGEERYQIGLENFQRIDRITTILDKELAHDHGISTLTPARYAIFNLKILFDVLWSTIHILKRVIEREQPDRICLYALPERRSCNRVYAFSNQESVFAEILTMTGWGVTIDIIRDIDAGIPYLSARTGEDLISRIFSWIKCQDLLFNLGLVAKRKGIRSAVVLAIHSVTSRPKYPALLYESGYNWDDSLIELYQGGITPVFRIRDREFNEILSRGDNYQEVIQKICNAHPGMREFDFILGIGVSAFFFNRVSEIIGHAFQESGYVYNITRKKIQTEKIRVLLHSSRERAIGHAIIQAAHDEEIPVVSWQHGGAGYCFNPMMPFIEFINSDWNFVFGKGVATSYITTSERIGLRNIPIMVPVGSSSLDEFFCNAKRLTAGQNPKPVVYITTVYMQNVFMMSQPSDLVGWDQRIWDIQKKILDLAKNNPEREFIIKLHPCHYDKEPLKTFVNDHKIHNVRLINTDMTIRELTDIAGMMIFDLISTGILQALTSEVPVFVYSNLHEIDAEPLELLKKRAYVYEKSHDFITNIQKFLRERKIPDYTPDLKNDDFLRHYGTDIQSRTSADKAAKTVKRIITEKQRG